MKFDAIVVAKNHFDYVLETYKMINEMCKKYFSTEDGSLHVEYTDGKVSCSVDSESDFRNDAFGRDIKLNFFQIHFSELSLSFSGFDMKNVSIYCDSREMMSLVLGYIEDFKMNNYKLKSNKYTTINNININNSSVNTSNIGGIENSITVPPQRTWWGDVWKKVITQVIYVLILAGVAWVVKQLSLTM